MGLKTVPLDFRSLLNGRILPNKPYDENCPFGTESTV